MKLNKQQGFTMIELIMVIVILGILAAVALPKFADLSGDARKAIIQGASGAVKSAAGIVHAQALVDNKTTTSDDSESVSLEGIAITLKFGYPNAASIAAAAGLAATDYHIASASGVTTISATKDGGATAVANCKFTYTPPTAANSSPAISVITESGC